MGIGHYEAVLLEQCIHAIVNIPVCVPVYTVVRPRPDHVFDGTLLVFAYRDERRRFIVNVGVRGYIFQQYFTHLIGWTVVGDCKIKVESPFFFRAVICYLSVSHFTVGHIYQDIFEREYFCMDKTDLFDKTSHSAHFDVIPNLEGFYEKQHEP